MPHQLCWLLTHQPQLRRSIACRTWQKFPKVKKEKKKKNLVVELTSLPLLSLFSCYHLTSSVISLYYSSFLSLPYLSISSPSHVLSHITIIYFSFILCGGLLVYEPPDISCEFTVVFWNLKQLFEILNFNYTCFHLLVKIMCLLLLLLLVFLLLSSKSFFYITMFVIIINAEI